MKISIAIPTYEMKPFGVEFLNFSLEKIYNQTYKNIEVVISDHCVNDDIKNLVDKWSDKLNIHYFKNVANIGSSSFNLNNAIINCSGDYIKVLFQDDFLYDEKSIENTIKYISKNTKWLVSTSEHSNDGITFHRTLRPRWNDDMWAGHNSISSPSVLTIKNDVDKLLFDDNLIWLMDCEYYQRCYNKFGMAVIIDEITVVNRTWQNQLTNTISDNTKKLEYVYVYEKFFK